MSAPSIPPAKLIDGKAIAAQLRTQIGAAVTRLKAAHNLTPGLAVVLVGEDAASEVYVRNKGIAAAAAGIESFECRLPADTTQEVLLNKVRELNNNPAVHGILVQFPVPDHISQQAVIETIAVEKDVDGLHPINAGRLASGLMTGQVTVGRSSLATGGALAPCTPLGCVILAQQVLGDLTGKHAVIIGRSNLVGKPVAQLLLAENCTVTIAHSRTKDLPALCCQADIVVAAVGIAELVKGDWIKKGACVIDVGINRVDAPEKGVHATLASSGGVSKTKLVGDVATAQAAMQAAYITPVPGGVGPMTIACLLRNTVTAACRQNGVSDFEG